MERVQCKQHFERLRLLPAAGPLLARLGATAGVHLVGGAVRDMLLGGDPADLDLVVEGDAAQLAAQLGGEVRRHDRFGTSTVALEGFSYDIASARRERYPRPGALPIVAPASLEDDLLRRDFTVNALAITLGGPSAGELSAAPGARADLQARRLRVMHPLSFVDDPTRLARLARYVSRLRFMIEPQTRQLAAEAVSGGALATLSGARLGAELRLMARERDPVGALGALRALGLDEAIRRGFGLEDPDLARRALALLPPDGRRDLLVLGAASMRLPASELAELLHALAFDATEREAVFEAATRAEAIAAGLEQATSPSQIADSLMGAGAEVAALVGALGPAAQAADWLERLRHIRLEIDGRDLLEAGVREGPAIGRGLHAALASKLDGGASGKEAELAVALRAAR